MTDESHRRTAAHIALHRLGFVSVGELAAGWTDATTATLRAWRKIAGLWGPAERVTDADLAALEEEVAGMEVVA